MRCDCCGKFFKNNALGSSHIFVPDSEVSYEELADRCPTCTHKHGRLRANQVVDDRLCAWISY